MTNSTEAIQQEKHHGQVDAKLDSKGTLARLKNMEVFNKWKLIFPEAVVIEYTPAI